MSPVRRAIATATLFLISTGFSACGLSDERRAVSTDLAPILLFNGPGTSSNDVEAIQSILDESHLNYAIVNSFQLNAMSESQIRAHNLLIFPGGNFVRMGNSLTARTTGNIRKAVASGSNYLGICAGGFLAGSFGGGYIRLNLTSGVQFGFYSAEGRGIRKAAVAIASPGAPRLDQYWEDGPQFTGWGAVVGKYPDGTPAIVEGAFGSGWVILAGVHPEAPASWRRGMSFNSPVGADRAYAVTLVRAALNGEALPHY